MFELFTIGLCVWAYCTAKKEHERDELHKMNNEYKLRCNKCGAMVNPRTYNTGNTVAYDCTCGHSFTKKW